MDNSRHLDADVWWASQHPKLQWDSGPDDLQEAVGVNIEA